VAGVVILLVLLLFVDLGSVLLRMASTFSDTATSRGVIWRETIPIVHNFWLTGSGAGTFGDVMTAYQRTWLFFPHLREYMHFNQAHNHYLQVATEGGLLLGLPLAVALAAIARETGRCLRHDQGEVYWIRVGATASLVGIGVQSIVEIPLIAPANALLAAVLLGIALHKREP
jgi:O-antigen ligase